MIGVGTVARFVRWSSRLSVLAGVTAFFAWLILFGINLHARSQAQSLLVEVSSLQVGTTTLEQARPILAAHHAETVSPTFSEQYSADIGFVMFPSNRTIRILEYRYYFLRYVGLAYWWFRTEMYFRNGTLSVLRVTMQTIANNQDGYTLETLESSARDTEFMMSGGIVEGGFWGQVHSISLPADTTLAERTHAFAYDLSCVTRLGGCRNLSQIISYDLIRQDYVARHPEQR
jgi:hypothetical protein